jgi:DNA-binding NarL/FixJ family response regulator
MRAHNPPAGDEPVAPTSILVAGGSFIGRGALVTALDAEPGFTVVGDGAHPAELRPLVAEHRPHVAVVIGEPDPLPAIRALTAAEPAPRVLVVSPFEQRLPGAEGVYPPEPAGRPPGPVAGTGVNLTDRAALVPAIRLLRSGYQVCPAPPVTVDAQPGALPPPHAWERFDKLTGREIEVVHLLLRGWTNAEIAEALTLSGATVKSHVHSLMSKLELRSRIDVITTAYTTGFIRPQ